MTQIARNLRHDLTSTEKQVWSVVRCKQILGLRFLRQHDRGHFVLDFYCASLRLALEIDGGIHALLDVERYDRDRELLLQEGQGIRFIRLTNDQIQEVSPDVLRQMIIECVLPFLSPDEVGISEGEGPGERERREK